MVKVAINGFGRIGRIAFRVATLLYSQKVKMVAVNTSGSMAVDGWAHLLRYDSVYKEFKKKIEVRKKRKGKEIGALVIDKKLIPVLAEREPAKIPWKKYQPDVVIESTGVFRERKLAAAHLRAGAKKVIISAPAKNTETFVIGGNEEQYRNNLVINMASCTTNCVVPITRVILEKFGIQKALMSTIHAYTADQEVVDGSHHDLRRARAAAVNIVPTTTGAALATTKVLPSLQGVFDGTAYRVPVVCGSISDFSCVTTKRTSSQEVNQALIKASKGRYKGIIGVSDQPLVSTDIIGSRFSATVDLSLTQVIDGDLVKVVAWYDNEWAYCCRLIEMAMMIGNKNE
jgi:glyceraldehyde 3-phosphate dehydrogenase